MINCKRRIINLYDCQNYKATNIHAFTVEFDQVDWMWLTSRASILIPNSIFPFANPSWRIQFYLKKFQHFECILKAGEDKFSWGGDACIVVHIIFLDGEILLSIFASDLCRNSENVPGLFEISQNLNELLLKCKCGWFTRQGANIFFSSV